MKKDATREREILARFLRNETQVEIAAALGVPKQTVGRTLKRRRVWRGGDGVIRCTGSDGKEWVWTGEHWATTGQQVEGARLVPVLPTSTEPYTDPIGRVWTFKNGRWGTDTAEGRVFATDGVSLGDSESSATGGG